MHMSRRQVWNKGWLVVILISVGTTASPQGLFESSQQGYHENEIVSNYFTLGGFIRSAGYVGSLPDNSGYYFQSAYGQAGLLMDAHAGQVATARADIRFRAGSEFQERFTEWMIREAYVDLSSETAGIRMGKMINPWGKGTIYNPTDKITPLDPTRRSPDEDDMLLGYWGVEGNVNLGSFLSLSATWKPVYQASVLLIDPVPMPGYVEFTDPWDPGVTLAEGSYGFHVSLHHPVADAGIYWFEGYHHWPGIALDTFILNPGTLEPESLRLMEQPYRIRMAGLDFSMPLGTWIIRAEGAWQQSVEDRTGREFVPFPELAYTAELERSLGAFDLIAGYYGKHILEFEEASAPPSLSPDREYFMQLIQQQVEDPLESIESLVRNQVAAFNRLYNYQLEATYHTAYLVVRGRFLNDLLEASLPVVYNVTTEEWILQPQVSINPADGIEITAGFSGLYGPEGSLYDLVGPVLNAGYLSMKVTF
jgi:hypothetical protein